MEDCNQPLWVVALGVKHGESESHVEGDSVWAQPSGISR